MKVLSTRRRREEKTVHAMIRLYCRHCHGGAPLCKDCEKLAAYASLRLSRCPFGEEKPTCAQCPIHCYKPAPRETMRQVMRFAGPRLLFRHPWLTLLHFWDSWRWERKTKARQGPLRSQLAK